MPILVVLLIALVTAVIFGPQLWVRHALKANQTARPDLPGTGGELARHLLDEAGLSQVQVVLTGEGDHYDPTTQTVHLRPEHHDQKSIAAVAVATHEVSHAVQHAAGERAFWLRHALVSRVITFDRIATVVLVTAPFLGLLVRSPALVLFQVVLGILLLSVRVLVHLVTLPVELDASFGKALPVLTRGGYLAENDIPAVRTVLRAAALTYVAAALASLLNLANWIRAFR